MKQKHIVSGQSLIEFALLLPLIVFLSLGFLDLGRAVFYYSSLSNAVREGTRDGVVMAYAGYTEDDLKTAVLSYGIGLTGTNHPLTMDDIIIEMIEENEDSPGFEKIRITANYCFVPVTPGMNLLITSTCGGATGIPLQAESIMWLEPGTE